MLVNRLGKAYLSPEDDGGGAPDPEDEGQEQETVIKIGEKEITTSELQALMDSEVAGNIKVNVGDGKTATLKTLREAARREPDVQTLLADERKKAEEKLEADRKTLMEEVAAERTKLVDEVGESRSSKVLKAISEALGEKTDDDPFANDASLEAWLKTMLEEKRDGVAALKAVVNYAKRHNDASVAELKKVVVDLTKQVEERDQKRENEDIQDFMRREVESIQEVFPDFDPEGDDEFSTMTMRLLTKKTPSKILDGKIGKSMKALTVAKTVHAHLGKSAEARVKADETSRKKDEEDAATTVTDRGTANEKLPDDLQEELDKAGVDVDKINAVMEKFADRRRGKK